MFATFPLRFVCSMQGRRQRYEDVVSAAAAQRWTAVADGVQAAGTVRLDSDSILRDTLVASLLHEVLPPLWRRGRLQPQLDGWQWLRRTSSSSSSAASTSITLPPLKPRQVAHALLFPPACHHSKHVRGGGNVVLKTATSTHHLQPAYMTWWTLVVCASPIQHVAWQRVGDGADAVHMFSGVVSVGPEAMYLPLDRPIPSPQRARTPTMTTTDQTADDKYLEDARRELHALQVDLKDAQERVRAAEARVLDLMRHAHGGVPYVLRRVQQHAGPFVAVVLQRHYDGDREGEPTLAADDAALLAALQQRYPQTRVCAHGHHVFQASERHGVETVVGPASLLPAVPQVDATLLGCAGGEDKRLVTVIVVPVGIEREGPNRGGHSGGGGSSGHSGSDSDGKASDSGKSNKNS